MTCTVISTKRKKPSHSARSEDINQSEHPSLCPSPLCCSVNGRWDGISYSVLFVDDRYGLMHQQLRVLFKMSSYTNTVWKPCGRKVCRPQHKHARRPSWWHKRRAPVHLVQQSFWKTPWKRTVWNVPADFDRILKLNTAFPNTSSFSQTKYSSLCCSYAYCPPQKKYHFEQSDSAFEGFSAAGKLPNSIPPTLILIMFQNFFHNFKPIFHGVIKSGDLRIISSSVQTPH